MSLVSIVCCQVDVPALGLLLVQRSPTEHGVSKCDFETSSIRRPGPSRSCVGTKEKYVVSIQLSYGYDTFRTFRSKKDLYQI
jgi:hypothetical protein